MRNHLVKAWSLKRRDWRNLINDDKSHKKQSDASMARLKSQSVYAPVVHVLLKLMKQVGIVAYEIGFSE
ncbi:unnamed protein product [Urochloa humidicola]